MIRKFTTMALTAASIAAAASITVDPSTKKQEIVGFGGGSVYYQSWITALADQNKEALFDTAFTGLNLSLLRIGNWLQADTAKVSPDDIAIVQAAKQRLGDHLKIEMSSWSAPGNLKPSGSVNGKDGSSESANSLKPASSDPYGKYAYRDIAIVCGSLDEYSELIAQPTAISPTGGKRVSRHTPQPESRRTTSACRTSQT